MTETQTIQDTTESLAEFFGFTAAVRIDAAGEVFEIPNPALLDDDQQARWEALQFEVEQCDRDDDGQPIRPHRIDGKLLPAYNVRLCRVLFGDRYEAFKAAGGSGSRVALIWARMEDEFAATPDE